MSSNEKRMPAFRLKYRNKEKQTFDCGVVWPGKFPDSYDIQPQVEKKGGQYPAIPLYDALLGVVRKEGWLSLVAVKSKSDKPQQTSSAPDDFSDDPF